MQKLSGRHGEKHIILDGDLNIDLIKHTSDRPSQNLVESMASSGFLQLISRPTRLTDHSATLIDHVYTNNLENTKSCNIITIDISDHLETSILLISLGNCISKSVVVRFQRCKDENMSTTVRRGNCPKKCHGTFERLFGRRRVNISSRNHRF